jgi:hypothetical protein
MFRPSLEARQPAVKFLGVELRTEGELPRADDRLAAEVSHLEGRHRIPQNQAVVATPRALREITATESASRLAGLKCELSSGVEVLAQLSEQGGVAFGHFRQFPWETFPGSFARPFTASYETHRAESQKAKPDDEKTDPNANCGSRSLVFSSLPNEQESGAQEYWSDDDNEESTEQDLTNGSQPHLLFVPSTLSIDYARRVRTRYTRVLKQLEEMVLVDTHCDRKAQPVANEFVGFRETRTERSTSGANAHFWVEANFAVRAFNEHRPAA